MSEAPTAEQRFPELSQFDLEREGSRGQWLVCHAEKDERAAAILADDDAVRALLCGAYRSVREDEVITTFRLTPKAWKEKSRG